MGRGCGASMPLWAHLSPDLHMFTRPEEPHPFRFLWHGWLHHWPLSPLSILFPLPGGQWDGTGSSNPWIIWLAHCQCPQPYGLSKSHLVDISKDHFQGFQEFCARNGDEDHVYISYYEPQYHRHPWRTGMRFFLSKLQLRKEHQWLGGCRWCPLGPGLPFLSIMPIVCVTIICVYFLFLNR